MKSTLEFLYSLRNQGSKFGIERMALFCKELGNPQHSFPSIHVAGTNGKGVGMHHVRFYIPSK